MLHNLLGKPALEAEGSHARVDRWAFRVLFSAAAFLILAFGVAFEFASATFVDPVEVRIALAAAAAGTVAASYWSTWVRDRLAPLARGFMYLTVIWFAVLLVVNGAAPGYALGSLWLWAAVLVAFSVGLSRMEPFRWFMGLGTVVFVAGLLVTPDPAVHPLLTILGFLGLDVIMYPVIHWRLQSEAERDAALAGLEERENLLRKRERAYRRLARESEVIFQESRDPIFFVDVDRDEAGAYLFEFLRLSVSHEDLTGMVSQDVRGKSPREVLGEEVGAQVAEKYRRCAEAREPIEYEEELPAPSGTKVWHTKLSPVMVDGKVTEIVGVAREITAQKRRERQMHVLDRMLHHDLRKDLTTAHGWAELIGSGKDPGKGSDRIATSTAHMMQILDAAKALQEAFRSGSEMEVRSVQLDPHLEQAVQIVRTRHPEAEINLERETRDVEVMANELLGSVFENLIANGVQHSDREHPEITISVRRRKETVEVHVADDGPGIPPAHREAIFAEEERGLESSGMGLGLYLVQTLLDLYEGKVEIEENEPRGTVFRVGLRLGTSTSGSSEPSPD